MARGGAETDEFVRQHDDVVAALTPRAASTRGLVIEHRNHFDITFDLADPTTLLGTAVFRQLGVPEIAHPPIPAAFDAPPHRHPR